MVANRPSEAHARVVGRETGRYWCYRDRMPFGVSIWEILILLLVILLVFGPKRLPEMGRSLGKGMREFKDSISGKDADEERAELPVGTQDTTAPAASRDRDAVS
jgi:sec-independent protein translocase protein TatA